MVRQVNSISIIVFMLMIFIGCDNDNTESPALMQNVKWSQTNGPNGGEITAFAVNGSNVLAGTLNGIFSSTDNGENWKKISTNVLVRSLVTGKDNSIFAATPDGVLISTDNGSKWTESKPGPNPIVNSLMASGTNVFAGTYGGIFL